jgi:hypothetical protein
MIICLQVLILDVVIPLRIMMQVFFHLQRGNGYINQGRRRTNDRLRRADREDSVRRTVYVSELDHTVSS